MIIFFSGSKWGKKEKEHPLPMKLDQFHTPISLKLQFSEGFALSVLGMFDYSLFDL